MTRQKLRHYVRTQRLAAGLSQAELGALLGYSESFIQKCETEQRPFTARYVIGCSIIFGKPIHELFPALSAYVQDSIGRGAIAIDEEVRDRADATARKKLALLKTITKHTSVIPEP